MLINKVTTGFVTQVFDTETGKYVSQSFTAGDVDYEDENGMPVDFVELADLGFGPLSSKEPYLPFDMVQPKNLTKNKKTT